MARQVVVGEIAGAYGVKGWVKVHSHTDPPSNILDYGPWTVSDVSGSKKYNILSGRMSGSSVVARLEGVEDRDEALKLKSGKIMVSRDRFPPAEPGHYYWVDLIGLSVKNLEGADFGSVEDMLATGANDVLVVKGERERLIPFILGQFVKDIKLDDGLMLVDWDADF